MARKTAAAAATSEGIENIPPKPKANAKATAKPAAAAGVKKKAVNRAPAKKPSTKKVAKIFYEFRYCNRTYSGFYTYREFMENCVKCLRHELSFLPKPLLTERAKKLWEAKASEVEGPHVVLKTKKKPAQAKKAKEVQPTKKRKNSKPIDLYEEPDNFYDWNDDDAAVGGPGPGPSSGPSPRPAASKEPPKSLKKTPVRKLPPKTTSAPKKLDFFLGDLLLLDSTPAEVGRPSVIQKYRTMLGNEFIPLDSSSPQVPAKKSSGGVPVKGGKGKQQQAAANNKPPPLTTMIELISG